MVCWPAVQHPWVPDEDGELEPDPQQDHDMWFGPFPTQRAASVFASRLRDTSDHRGRQVGRMYAPDSDIALDVSETVYGDQDPTDRHG